MAVADSLLYENVHLEGKDALIVTKMITITTESQKIKREQK